MYNIVLVNVKRFRALCGFYTIENKLLLLGLPLQWSRICLFLGPWIVFALVCGFVFSLVRGLSLPRSAGSSLAVDLTLPCTMDCSLLSPTMYIFSCPSGSQASTAETNKQRMFLQGHAQLLGFKFWTMVATKCMNGTTRLQWLYSVCDLNKLLTQYPF